MFVTHAHDRHFSAIWSYWCISQSCNSTIELNVAFIHSIQLEAKFVEILKKQAIFYKALLRLKKNIDLSLRLVTILSIDYSCAKCT